MTVLAATLCMCENKNIVDSIYVNNSVHKNVASHATI